MADLASYAFSAELWEWEAKKSWTFVSTPEDVADDIEERFGRSAAGFGSIRVEVTVGDTVWRTSLFPSNEEKTYVLPVKKAVRTAEGLEIGSVVEISLLIFPDGNEQRVRRGGGRESTSPAARRC